MELKVQKRIEIQDGKHEGKITKVEFRTEPYSYTDVFIKPKDMEFELKYGCPTLISANSKLGKLLLTFGVELKEGEKIDPEKVLVGKEVQFMTLTETTDRGTFARVVDNSVKPINFTKVPEPQDVK